MDDLSNTEKMLKLYVKITPMQRKIVDALGSGMTRKEVCKLLRLTKSNLSNHISRMYSKLRKIKVD